MHISRSRSSGIWQRRRRQQRRQATHPAPDVHRQRHERFGRLFGQHEIGLAHGDNGDEREEDGNDGEFGRVLQFAMIVGGAAI